MLPGHPPWNSLSSWKSFDKCQSRPNTGGSKLNNIQPQQYDIKSTPRKADQVKSVLPCFWLTNISDLKWRQRAWAGFTLLQRTVIDVTTVEHFGSVSKHCAPLSLLANYPILEPWTTQQTPIGGEITDNTTHAASGASLHADAECSIQQCCIPGVSTGANTIHPLH